MYRFRFADRPGPRGHGMVERAQCDIAVVLSPDPTGLFNRLVQQVNVIGMRQAAVDVPTPVFPQRFHDCTKIAVSPITVSAILKSDCAVRSSFSLSILS
jgi:hypothetical protein